MKPTRRQFVGSAITSLAWLAAGGEAIAKTLASADIRNKGTQKHMNGNTQWKTVNVSDNTQMRVFTARPEGAKGKVPGVLVLQEAFGVNAHIRDVAQRIAALGYVTAAPELYHRTAPGFESGYDDTSKGLEEMKKVTDDGLEADLKATYDLLTQESSVNAERIGSVGYCMGGRTSFLANAVLPLKAAVSYYGGGIAKTLLPRAKDQHGPILLFWGGKDTHVGRDQQNAVAKALKDAGKVYTDVEFSEAEHGFFCDQRKSYNPVASRESWALFAEFLRINLNGKS